MRAVVAPSKMANDQSGGVVAWLAEYPNLKSMRIGGFGLMFVLFGAILLRITTGGFTMMQLSLIGFGTVMCLWIAWAGWYTS